MYQIYEKEFREVHELCVARIFVWKEAEDAKMRRRMEKRGALPQNSPVPRHYRTREEEEAKQKEEKLAKEKEGKELAEDDTCQSGPWAFLARVNLAHSLAFLCNR